jgi:hypothetical protein
MPQPSAGDVHVNGPLTNLSVAIMQDASGFIADKVFPTVPVAKQSDLFYVYTKEDFLRDEARVRAPGTASAGGGFTVSTSSYSCVVEAYHKDVDDQVRTNSDSVLQLDRAATEFVTQKMLIRRERKWATAFFGTGIWGTDITPGTLWSAASSTPRKDVETGKTAILKVTGFKPNTMVLGAEVYAALRSNAEVVDQFKYTSANSIDSQMLKGYFDVENILIMNSVYTSSAEGAGTQTTTFVGGKHALLCYAAPAPSLMTPSAGYTFSWTGFTGSVNGVRVKRFRMEEYASDRIEMEHSYDMKAVVPSLGYFFGSVVS